ncbi:MAG: hypothetical protein IMZ61_16355 [Planctomycetes bacterium]|nr:hypothetical protein [Planctomycetota bacterium]
MSTKVQVEMVRGGFISLEVEGRIYPHRDGSGRQWTEVEIHSINWPGGGKVADKNIADITQVEEAFEGAFKEALENQREDAYIDFCERRER